MEILGIDVGGTGIKSAIVDTGKGILLTERYRICTPDPATPEAISGVISDIAGHFEWNGMIGCGFPSVVRHDIVKTAVNIHKSWVDINLAKLIVNATGCKTSVINDADAAGIAEMKFGAGRNNNGVVFIVTIGTGVGTALFTQGKLLPNSEYGQLLMKNDIAENYISARVKEEQNLNWKKWAVRFNEFIESVGNLLYPDLVIIGGGISKKPEKFIDRLSSGTKIEIAKFKNNAGIIGAAIFAEQCTEE